MKSVFFNDESSICEKLFFRSGVICPVSAILVDIFPIGIVDSINSKSTLPSIFVFKYVSSCVLLVIAIDFKCRFVINEVFE